MEDLPKISVIIPVYNEEKYIAQCIESIVRSSYDKRKMEILFVDGGSTDRTVEIIRKYQKKYSFIKLLYNPKKIVPSAMNIGIRESKGDYIIRVDAHSKYPRDYFNKLIYWHRKLDADNVGGVIVTETKNRNKVSNAIKNVLSDKFGVGSVFRCGTQKIQEVDTVPFGCYKREIFEIVGLYNEKLVRNQDIELNKRIKKIGGKIYIVPSIKCIYFARETYKDLARNSFENGYWNMLTIYYTRSFKSLSFRHFVPLGFILSLLCSLILSILDMKFFYLFVTILGVYLAIVIVRSLQIKEGTTLIHQILAFLTLHLSYSVGELVGILKVLYLITFNHVKVMYDESKENKDCDVKISKCKR